MAGAEETAEGRSRRDLLKALGAAAAGAVAASVINSEKAEATHGNLNVVSDTEKPAIHAENRGFGLGLEVTSDNEGVKVTASGVGLRSESAGHGVVGISSDHYGVQGISSDAAGVYGSSPLYFGVWGEGGETGVTGISREDHGPGVGVSGIAPEGTGVRGSSGGIGVQAVSAGGTALQVEGKARFSTAAAGTVPAGQDSAFINNPAVTALSHVTVTLTGDPGQASSAPGSKALIAWVERRPGTGFVVHMSRPVRFATAFTYLIVEPV